MVLKYLPVHLVVAAIRSFRQNLPTAINHDIHYSFFRVLHKGTPNEQHNKQTSIHNSN